MCQSVIWVVVYIRYMALKTKSFLLNSNLEESTTISDHNYNWNNIISVRYLYDIHIKAPKTLYEMDTVLVYLSFSKIWWTQKLHLTYKLQTKTSWSDLRCTYFSSKFNIWSQTNVLGVLLEPFYRFKNTHWLLYTKKDIL